MKEKRIIDSIDKSLKKDKVILIGRGPSTDDLDLKKINSQTDYDTCTIADAIKIIDHPTYSINYHFVGLTRILSYCHRPKYVIFPIQIISSRIYKANDRGMKVTEDSFKRYTDFIDSLSNVYYMESVNLKIDKLKEGSFRREVRKEVVHTGGSLVGTMHFLMGYMGYKKIYYIGFDGGTEYGKLVANPRKPTKAEGAARDYKKAWDTNQILLSFYPDVEFKPLEDFMIKKEEIV